MDSKQIDVMVADASHEVYVDKILDTIREAAKVRGTGIAERTHEYVATKMKEGKAIIALCGDEFCRFHLHRELGQQAICSNLRSDSTPQIPGTGTGKTYQDRLFPPGTPTLAQCQSFQSHQWSCRHENEYRARICARHLQRTNR